MLGSLTNSRFVPRVGARRHADLSRVVRPIALRRGSTRVLRTLIKIEGPIEFDRP
jgi:hypothetical protein